MPVAADPAIENVVLLACGSYNPVTNMHLRMFEVARDSLRKSGRFRVLGGIISPVADAYGKEDLASAQHRLEMLRLALRPPCCGHQLAAAASSPPAWIRLGSWEASRRRWTPTKQVLDHYQAVIDNELAASSAVSALSARSLLAGGCRGSSSVGVDCHSDSDEESAWLRKIIRRLKSSSAAANAAAADSRAAGDAVNPALTARLMLLCGADLLASFSRPGLWRTEDIISIARDYGMVVLTRNGHNPHQFIYECDAINPFEQNFVILSEWCCNDTSSSQVRRALRRGESVRYLLPDCVIDYVCKHRLYGCRADWPGQSVDYCSADTVAQPSASATEASGSVVRYSRGCQTSMTGASMPGARIRKECRACGARSTRHIFLASSDAGGDVRGREGANDRGGEGHGDAEGEAGGDEIGDLPHCRRQHVRQRHHQHHRGHRHHRSFNLQHQQPETCTSHI